VAARQSKSTSPSSPEAQDCPELGAPLVLTGDDEPAWRGVRLSDGERMRLYLLDLPESTTTKVLAIAIVAPGATFDDVVAAAAPILGSIAIHAQS